MTFKNPERPLSAFPDPLFMRLPEGCVHLLPSWDTLVKSSSCLQMGQARINTGGSGNLASK